MKIWIYYEMKRHCAGKNLCRVLPFYLFTFLLLSCSVSYKFNGASIDYTKTKTIQINDFPIRSSYVWGPMGPMFNNELKCADSEEVKKVYGISLLKPATTKSAQFGKGYDAVVVAVAHKQFKDLKEKDFIEVSGPDALLVDIKGLYRGKIRKMRYWSL